MNALVAITIGAMSAAIVTLAFAVWTKKDWLKDFISGGIVIWFAIYAILFFDNSFSGAEKTLALDTPKEFCKLYLDSSPDATSSRFGARNNQGNKNWIETIFTDGKDIKTCVRAESSSANW